MATSSSPMSSPTDDRPAHQRAKSSSFSLRSTKSDKSTGSKRGKPKMDLTETDRDRRQSKFSGVTHVNPNKAMLEAQPSVIAQETATMGSLRSFQHKDWKGNAITDPDSSNPARSRMERPLDTIRSFEAAIEGGRDRRTRLPRSESADMLSGYSSRRSSVVGEMVPSSRAPSAFGMYPSNPRRPNNWQRDPYQQRDYNDGRPQPQPARRAPNPRMASAPSYYNRPYAQDGYPQHGHHESYDTNAESTGSHSDPWGNSTDPSSENSSVDRIHAAREGDAYQHNGPYLGRGSPGTEQNGHVRKPNGYVNGFDYSNSSYQAGPLQNQGHDRYHQQRPSPPLHDNRRPSASRLPIPLVPEADDAVAGPIDYSQNPTPGYKPHKNYSAPLPGQMNGGHSVSRPWAPQPSQSQSQSQNLMQRPQNEMQRGSTLKKKQAPEPKEEKKSSWLRRTFSRRG